MVQPAKFWERIFSTAQPLEPSEDLEDTESTDNHSPSKSKNAAALHSSLELILWSKKTALQAEELRQLLKTACTHLYDQGEALQQYKGEVLALRKLVEDLGATVASTNAAHKEEAPKSLRLLENLRSDIKALVTQNEEQRHDLTHSLNTNLLHQILAQQEHQEELLLELQKQQVESQERQTSSLAVILMELRALREESIQKPLDLPSNENAKETIHSSISVFSTKESEQHVSISSELDMEDQLFPFLPPESVAGVYPQRTPSFSSISSQETIGGSSPPSQEFLGYTCRARIGYENAPSRLIEDDSPIRRTGLGIYHRLLSRLSESSEDTSSVIEQTRSKRKLVESSDDEDDDLDRPLRRQQSYSLE